MRRNKRKGEERVMVDFSEFDFDNLTEVQLGELYTLADEAISHSTVRWEDPVGTHHLLLIDENDPNFAYFTAIRVEIRRELVPSTNEHVRQSFGKMLGLPPANVVVSNIETVVHMYLHVRGTPDHEIIKVKV